MHRDLQVVPMASDVKELCAWSRRSVFHFEGEEGLQTGVKIPWLRKVSSTPIKTKSVTPFSESLLDCGQDELCPEGSVWYVLLETEECLVVTKRRDILVVPRRMAYVVETDTAVLMATGSFLSWRRE